MYVFLVILTTVRYPILYSIPSISTAKHLLISSTPESTTQCIKKLIRVKKLSNISLGRNSQRFCRRNSRKVSSPKINKTGGTYQVSKYPTRTVITFHPQQQPKPVQPTRVATRLRLTSRLTLKC